MKIVYFLSVHYAMCFIVMAGVDTMKVLKNITTSGFSYAVLSAAFLGVIFTLPIVVLGTVKKK